MNEKIIGQVKDVTEDFCDTSYPRRGGTVLNINPNARTSCHGCKFCYTAYQVPRDRERLLSHKTFSNFLNNWRESSGTPDLSQLVQVAVVTGCFGSEQKAVSFLKMARKVLDEFQFKGELLYFGSEITSKAALNQLEEVKPFSLCLSIDCFENRNVLLRDIKRRISVDTAKEILLYSKMKGFRTNFSYIVGLEPVEVISSMFPEIIPNINSFPIINTLQVHKNQDKMRHKSARTIDYYLRARKRIEEFFLNTKMRPRPWENYRSLWYLQFHEEILSDIRTPNIN